MVEEVGAIAGVGIGEGYKIAAKGGRGGGTALFVCGLRVSSHRGSKCGADYKGFM